MTRISRKISSREGCNPRLGWVRGPGTPFVNSAVSYAFADRLRSLQTEVYARYINQRDERVIFLACGDSSFKKPFAALFPEHTVVDKWDLLANGTAERAAAEALTFDEMVRLIIAAQHPDSASNEPNSSTGRTRLHPHAQLLPRPRDRPLIVRVPPRRRPSRARRGALRGHAPHGAVPAREHDGRRCAHAAAASDITRVLRLLPLRRAGRRGCLLYRNCKH